MKRPLIAFLLIALLAGCAPAMETKVPVPTHQYAPRPGDAAWTRGPVYLDAAELIIRESAPPQIAVRLQGSLPTPCHQLRAVIPAPDAERRIAIEVYAVSDPDALCVQMLAPFEATLELGTFAPGTYTVLVNGEEIGRFDG